VSTWATSDATVRWQAFDRVALEGQLKLVNPVSPFLTVPVGGAVGARVRLREQDANGTGLAIELAPRFVGLGVQQSVTRSQDLRTQTDTWNYRAVGAELPLVGTVRISREVAVTVSPFVRAYWIKAWHSVVAPDSTISTTRLPWTPVLAGGLGVSVALDFGPVQIAPGIAVELGARPGGDQKASLLFEPGFSVGTRF
jgi:hypothetical protein